MVLLSPIFPTFPLQIGPEHLVAARRTMFAADSTAEDRPTRYFALRGKPSFHAPPEFFPVESSYENTRIRFPLESGIARLRPARAAAISARSSCGRKSCAAGAES